MNNPHKFLGIAAAALLAGTVQAQDTDPAVTYNGEAGRIINENCVVCHREGGIGPMQFESYEQVRPWAPLIQFKVANREMPPWDASPAHHGVFEDERVLTEEEIATLRDLAVDPFDPRINPNGGAIALGHPLGASGTKLMATLVHALHRHGKKYGLQTMCEGGGVANVTIVEAL